jgi:hypothetical protein
MDREGHVWIDGKKIVAVRPTTAFADLFVPGNANTAAPEETTVLNKTGATGLEPGLSTSSSVEIRL